MFVIVESRGRQYKVSQGDVVTLDRLNIAKGGPYVFDKVLMFVDDEKRVILDKEKLEDIKVSGVVTDEKKGDKLLVFKYKRRKGYHRKRGHRQKYSLVKIEDIESPFTSGEKTKTDKEEDVIAEAK